jgi:tyrosyl-tRNA synthetase
MHVLDELYARGLVQDCTDRDGLKKRLDEGPLVYYCGYDPTSSTLHPGTMVGFSVMRRLQEAGHTPIGVVGGSTGMVGDPSGKTAERKLLDLAQIEQNLAGIRKQVQHFLPGARVVNNYDWTKMGVMEFLRDVGKHITVNYMLAKESVRARLEDRDQGISYTEFSYMLLQAWDFAHLAREQGCVLQVGGSDQWGNITCGIELSRKLGHPQQLYGLVTPLLMTASGAKFGKSEGGTTVWLDAEQTSPYALYQFWINTEDADVDKYLKYFTWLSLDEIAELVREHDKDRGKRLAQRELAARATAWVHGEQAAKDALRASEVIFGGLADIGSLSGGVLELILREVPSSAIARAELDARPPLLEALVRVGLADSKGAAKRLVTQGGVSVNGAKVTDEKRVVSGEDVLPNGLVVLRAGKKNYHLLRVSSR